MKKQQDEHKNDQVFLMDINNTKYDKNNIYSPLSIKELLTLEIFTTNTLDLYIYTNDMFEYKPYQDVDQKKINRDISYKS